MHEKVVLVSQDFLDGTYPFRWGTDLLFGKRLMISKNIKIADRYISIGNDIKRILLTQCCQNRIRCDTKGAVAVF